MIEEARAVGITLAPKAYDQSVLYAPDGPLYHGTFQAALLGLQNDGDPDPSAYVSCDQRPPNGFNFARYCSEESTMRCDVRYPYTIVPIGGISTASFSGG
jgi:hypothetical protein